MIFKIQVLAVIFLAIGLATQNASAFPRPQQPMTATVFNALRPSSEVVGVDFSGIVALSNCSGSLVRFENSVPTDRAMVLTNGHCFEQGMPKPGQVAVNVPSTRTFALLKPDASRYGTLQAEMVLFSSMTKSDMTLYRLNQTYADIAQKFSVQPLVISSHHPVAGTHIAVVSGYWKKIYSCQIDKFVYELKEANWTFFDSIRYSQPGCQVIGGTSGSPIVDEASHEIIGINNTINENGARCTMDNPCEVDEHGNVTVSIHTGYGQETFWLYSCLDAQKNIDLNKQGCMLKP